jgi:hypothetical protein
LGAEVWVSVRVWEGGLWVVWAMEWDSDAALGEEDQEVWRLSR